MLAALLATRGAQPTPPTPTVRYDGYRPRIELQRQIGMQFLAQDDEDIILMLQALIRKL